MIKKTLSFIFSFIIGAIGLVAQEVEQETPKVESGKFEREWNVGANFGVNLSQASFANSYRGNPLKTYLWQQYQGGVSLRYITEKNLGFIVELNYSQQGWQEKFEDVDDAGNVFERTDYEHEHQLNYLNIPFLTHIYFGDKVRFFFNLGPQIGFLIGENETMNDKLREDLASGSYSPSKSTGQFFHKADRKFDYGIVAGMGLEFRTGIGHFALEGRYTFGLGDFYNNKKSDHFQRSAHRVIGVKMTYYTKLF